MMPLPAIVRFLKRLEAANIPYLTATACLVYLYKNKKVERGQLR